MCTSAKCFLYLYKPNHALTSSFANLGFSGLEENERYNKKICDNSGIFMAGEVSFEENTVNVINNKHKPYFIFKLRKLVFSKQVFKSMHICVNGR